MSIQSEINRIAGAKSDIADAIEDMGGTLSSEASIDDMAAGVRSIPQGTSDYTDLTNKPQINSVTLTGNKSISDIGAASQSDLEDLEDITGDGQLSGFTATDLTGAANELKNTLNQLVLIGNTTAINQNGTYAKENVTGMTANHKVANWGLFSDANLTTPISSNNPPADITIAEESGGYVITIANYTSAFYMKPTFILPQN